MHQIWSFDSCNHLCNLCTLIRIALLLFLWKSILYFKFIVLFTEKLLRVFFLSKVSPISEYAQFNVEAWNRLTGGSVPVGNIPRVATSRGEFYRGTFPGGSLPGSKFPWSEGIYKWESETEGFQVVSICGAYISLRSGWLEECTSRMQRVEVL